MFYRLEDDRDTLKQVVSELPKHTFFLRGNSSLAMTLPWKRPTPETNKFGRDMDVRCLDTMTGEIFYLNSDAWAVIPRDVVCSGPFPPYVEGLPEYADSIIDLDVGDTFWGYFDKHLRYGIKTDVVEQPGGTHIEVLTRACRWNNWMLECIAKDVMGNISGERYSDDDPFMVYRCDIPLSITI